MQTLKKIDALDPCKLELMDIEELMKYLNTTTKMAGGESDGKYSKPKPKTRRDVLLLKPIGHCFVAMPIGHNWSPIHAGLRFRLESRSGATATDGRWRRAVKRRRTSRQCSGRALAPCPAILSINWTFCPQNGLSVTQVLPKSPFLTHWLRLCNILRRSAKEPGRKAT